MAARKHRRMSVDVDAFTERLNRLFAVVYPPGRGPYRNVEVTEALAGRGYQLSAPYLSQLRSGVRGGPSSRARCCCWQVAVVRHGDITDQILLPVTRPRP